MSYLKQGGILLLFLFILQIKSNAQGISFNKEMSWQQIIQKAKTENKLIFIDAYTTWCGPCKAMDKETFSMREVGDFMNDRFISVKVQMDKTKSDNERIRSWYIDAKIFEDKYEIKAYPSVLFIGPDGKLINRSVGYIDGNGLLLAAKKAIEMNGVYAAEISNFDQGKLDTAAMKQLAKKALKLKDLKIVYKVSEQYIKDIKVQDLFTKHQLLFIGSTLSSKSSFFNLFFNEPAKVNNNIRENYAESQVMRVIYQEEIEPYDKAEKPDWLKIEKTVVSKYGALGEEQVWGNMMVYYNSIKDWNNFGKFYKLYFDRAIPKKRSIVHINNMSWPVFVHITDSAILKTAINAMDYNIDNFQRYDPNGIDTYANLKYKAFLLHNIGKKEDALWWSELAGKLANQEKGYVETLEKMKRGEVTWKE